MPFGLGTSSGSSQSTSSSSGGSFVDPNQQGFLDFLRNSAMSGFGGFQQGGNQLAQQFGQFGQQAGQFGQQNPFQQGLMDQAGGNPELLAQQQQQLGTDIQQQIGQGLAQANRGAVGGGGLGGGRNQVARGTAVGLGADAFARGSNQLAQNAQQNQIQAGAIGGQQFGQQQQAGLQGLGMQGQFAGQGFQSMFAPLQGLQGLFGAPTVLSRQQSQSQSSARNRSFNFGLGEGGLFGSETNA